MNDDGKLMQNACRLTGFRKSILKKSHKYRNHEDSSHFSMKIISQNMAGETIKCHNDATSMHETFNKTRTFYGRDQDWSLKLKKTKKKKNTKN